MLRSNTALDFNLQASLPELMLISGTFITTVNIAWIDADFLKIFVDDLEPLFGNYCSTFESIGFVFGCGSCLNLLVELLFQFLDNRPSLVWINL